MLKRIDLTRDYQKHRKEYLEAIGVDRYEPLEIIRKTQGRMAGDDLWLTVEELK